MIAERNYRKHPHTARFLMAFHTAGGTNLGGGAVAERQDDNAAEYALAASEADDLLNQVADLDVVDLRTPRQAELMESLHTQLMELDAETGRKAIDYTVGMTIRGRWTAGRQGNASAWIDKMIVKVRELRTAARTQAPAVEIPTVADGRYAVEENGVLKFFRVKNGRRPGFVFLDIQASDDWHAVRNVTRIHEVLRLIAVDAKAALVRYGVELGQCGRCGRTLTSEYRNLGLGPICIDK